MSSSRLYFAATALYHWRSCVELIILARVKNTQILTACSKDQGGSILRRCKQTLIRSRFITSERAARNDHARQVGARHHLAHRVLGRRRWWRAVQINPEPQIMDFDSDDSRHQLASARRLPSPLRLRRSAASGITGSPSAPGRSKGRGSTAGGSPLPVTAWIGAPGRWFLKSSISRGTQASGATAPGVHSTINCSERLSSCAIRVSMSSAVRASSRSWKMRPRRAGTGPWRPLVPIRGVRKRSSAPCSQTAWRRSSRR